MGTDVDPFLEDVPKKWVDKNGSLTDESREFMEYFTRWAHDMWSRTGAGIDLVFQNENNITNITSNETFETSSGSGEAHELFNEAIQLEDLIPTARYRDFKSEIITSDKIAVDGDFWDIRSGATVTLDPNAQWNNQIITTNGDSSSIKVTSAIELRYAGKRDYTFVLNNEGTSIHWYLFSNGLEKFWRGS